MFCRFAPKLPASVRLDPSSLRVMPATGAPFEAYGVAWPICNCEKSEAELVESWLRMAKPGRIFCNSVASRPETERRSMSALEIVEDNCPLSSGRPATVSATVTDSVPPPTSSLRSVRLVLSPGFRCTEVRIKFLKPLAAMVRLYSPAGRPAKVKYGTPQ